MRPRGQSRRAALRDRLARLHALATPDENFEEGGGGWRARGPRRRQIVTPAPLPGGPADAGELHVFVDGGQSRHQPQRLLALAEHVERVPQTAEALAHSLDLAREQLILSFECA